MKEQIKRLLYLLFPSYFNKKEYEKLCEKPTPLVHYGRNFHTICNTNVKDNFLHTSDFYNHITCPTCKQILNTFHNIKRCSFCNTPLTHKDYEDPNDFFLACPTHKQLAQIETEKFFQQNPDYTKWNKDKPN